MKRVMLLAIVAVVLAAASISFILSPRGSGSEKVDQPAGPGDGIIEVNSLADTPPAVGSYLVVRGVVEATKSDASIFALVDSCEGGSCDTSSCATFRLPIRYLNQLPEVGQTAVVRGRIVQMPDGLLIEAEEVTTP